MGHGSPAQTTEYSASPGSSLTSQETDSDTVCVGDLGPVSIREIHSALLRGKRCTCGAETLPADTEDAAFAELFQGTASWHQDHFEPLDWFDRGRYSPPHERPRFEVEDTATPAWPDCSVSCQSGDLTSMWSDSFIPCTNISRDYALVEEPQGLPMEQDFSLMGGADHHIIPSFEQSNYKISSRGRPVLDDRIREEGEPRFTCSYCRESFPTSYELESHARTTTHLAYVCPESGCTSRYYRRDSFVRHIKTHRQSGLHYCKICQQNKQRKAFKRKDHLRQHIQQLHPGRSVQEASGMTPTTSRSSSVASQRSLDAPSCRGGTATSVGDRLKADMARDRGVALDRL